MLTATQYYKYLERGAIWQHLCNIMHISHRRSGPQRPSPLHRDQCDNVKAGSTLSALQLLQPWGRVTISVSALLYQQAIGHQLWGSKKKGLNVPLCNEVSCTQSLWSRAALGMVQFFNCLWMNNVHGSHRTLFEGSHSAENCGYCIALYFMKIQAIKTEITDKVTPNMSSGTHLT